MRGRSGAGITYGDNTNELSQLETLSEITKSELEEGRGTS